MEKPEDKGGTSAEDISRKPLRENRSGEDHLIDPSTDMTELLKKSPEDVKEKPDDAEDEKKSEDSKAKDESK